MAGICSTHIAEHISTSTTVLRPRLQVAPRALGNGNGRPAVATAFVPTRADEVVYAPDQVFTCPEESLFYSSCLQRVLTGTTLTTNGSKNPVVVEFGAGDGSPVIDALLKTGPRFQGKVHGFELNPRAAGIALNRSKQLGLDGKYQVRHSCFFKGAEELRDTAEWLVANPPYLPAPDNKIMMPELFGGLDGASLTNDLLSLDYPNAMLLVSSYSNPLGTLEHAKKLGYSITDFLVTALPFGTYSSEPKVKNWIRKLKTEGKAFFSERPSTIGGTGWYLLAGVVFQKLPVLPGSNGKVVPQGQMVEGSDPDATDELIRVLTAL